MNKIVVCVLMGLVFIGCQPKEEDNAATSGNNVAMQRKDASRKLTSQAIAMLGQKNFQAAVTSLDAAIKFDPSNQDPYLLLGQILIKSGENAHAMEFLNNAVKNFPDNGMLFYMLSIVNKLENKKLPAVLAARRSFEIFKNAKDDINAQNSAVLLKQIIDTPDAPDTNAK